MRLPGIFKLLSFLLAISNTTAFFFNVCSEDDACEDSWIFYKMYRVSPDQCTETCVFSIFVFLWSLFGWECGTCVTPTPTKAPTPRITTDPTPSSSTVPTKAPTAPRICPAATEVGTLKFPPDIIYGNQTGDCNRSAKLKEAGLVLWVLCDPGPFAFPDQVAALASAADPETIIEVKTIQMIPDEWDPEWSCTGAEWNKKTWVTGLTPIPSSPGEDRVLAYFSSYCVPTNTFHARGVALLTYTNGVLTTNVLNSRLWTAIWFNGDQRELYGRGAVEEGGFVYTYSELCRTPSVGCRIARALVEEAGDIKAYAYWDGDGNWIQADFAGCSTVACEVSRIRANEETALDPAAEVVLPMGPTGGETRGSMAVGKIPLNMTLSLFFSGTELLIPPFLSKIRLVRFAFFPEGPWSEAFEYVPESPCNPYLDCYTWVPHPVLSDPGVSVAFSYYTKDTLPRTRIVRFPLCIFFDSLSGN